MCDVMWIDCHVDLFKKLFWMNTVFDWTALNVGAYWQILYALQFKCF